MNQRNGIFFKETSVSVVEANPILESKEGTYFKEIKCLKFFLDLKLT
jgi:hypothetical protein